MENTYQLPGKIVQLIKKGVTIPRPRSIEIGDDVDTERISGNGVVFYNGTRIHGAKTLIGPKSRLGCESPVTVVNCQLGPEVELKGGFFRESVFLKKANMASGAQVREGCILEEEANGSHTVGLKQTILFPFVTLGSLINFCDCFMAGGTSRKNHSEVGSSYIHFNYTPNQDKATASLIGDVPRGVVLNEPPIFLGGQGGLAGPVRIGYGTAIAAGVVYRRDCLEGGKLITRETEPTTHEKRFVLGFYGDIKRKTLNNIYYLANLLALRQWYLYIRQPFFRLQELGPDLYEGAIEKLDMAIEERLKRFEAFSEKMEKSIELGNNFLPDKKKQTLIQQKKEFLNNWSDLKACFTKGKEENIGQKERNAFVKIIKNKLNNDADYINTIQSLNAEDSIIGTTWLQQIVDEVTHDALNVIPSFQ